MDEMSGVPVGAGNKMNMDFRKRVREHLKYSHITDYGYRIRDERIRLKLLQREVAVLCCKSRSTPGKWENGQVFPSLQVLERLCYKGFDIVYILTGKRNIKKGI